MALNHKRLSKNDERDVVKNTPHEAAAMNTRQTSDAALALHVLYLDRDIECRTQAVRDCWMTPNRRFLCASAS